MPVSSQSRPAWPPTGTQLPQPAATIVRRRQAAACAALPPQPAIAKNAGVDLERTCRSVGDQAVAAQTPRRRRYQQPPIPVSVPQTSRLAGSGTWAQSQQQKATNGSDGQNNSSGNWL